MRSIASPLVLRQSQLRDAIRSSATSTSRSSCRRPSCGVRPRLERRGLLTMCCCTRYAKGGMSSVPMRLRTGAQGTPVVADCSRHATAASLRRHDVGHRQTWVIGSRGGVDGGEFSMWITTERCGRCRGRFQAPELLVVGCVPQVSNDEYVRIIGAYRRSSTAPVSAMRRSSTHAEVIGLGMTHYPMLAGADTHMANLMKSVLKDPDIPRGSQGPGQLVRVSAKRVGG